MTVAGERKHPIVYSVDSETFRKINSGIKVFIIDWEDLDALPPGTFLLVKEQIEGEHTGSTCLRCITYVEQIPQGDVVIRAIRRT